MQLDMSVLAIDPGPMHSAYVIWNGSKIIEMGMFPNGYMADEIVSERSCWMDYLAIEMIACYGMPVGAEVFETCVWIGRFMERWAFRLEEATIFRIPRGDIKVHLCRSVRAKDANVRQALIDRFGAPGTKKNPGVLYGVKSHCWAALACGVVAHDRLACGIKEVA